MAIGYFCDKNHQPEQQEILAALGSRAGLWTRLVGFIEETYRVAGILNFGGKNYGWNLWCRKGGKALISLYPQQEGLVAQVVLGKPEVEKAMQLEMGESISRRLRETPQLNDGKWLFIPVLTEGDAADVEKLLLVKRKPSK